MFASFIDKKQLQPINQTGLKAPSVEQQSKGGQKGEHCGNHHY